MSTAPPTTNPPTTAAPTTLGSTAAPTTAAPTTAPSTTLTTAVPTTAAPTTVPPTTPSPVLMEGDPIEIWLSIFGTSSVHPPAAVNPALNKYFTADPIEITLSIEGRLRDTAIVVDPVGIDVTLHGSFGAGVIFSGDPIPIEVSISPLSEMALDYENRNWIWWSKVGYLDFTRDESNVAGRRPLDWRGSVWHIAKLGDRVGVYGENGATFIKPSGVHYGMETFYRIGLKNKGAFADGENYHLFVDKLSQLCKVTREGIELLDYKEYISQMGTVILSLDREKELLYITDNSTGYIFSVRDNSFAEGPVSITGIGVRDNILHVVNAVQAGPTFTITTPKFQICTDIYDLGSRKPKTITRVELGTDAGEFLQVSVDYRLSYRDSFKQIGWFTVNHDGRAYPKCYGVEFRFRVKSSIYEYLELDYIKIRGHIHGYSYLDTA